MADGTRRGLALVLSLAGGLAGAWAGWTAATGGPDSSADVEHILRIEAGLLPPIAISGQPTPTYTLAERMEHYKVPGVSVAFFENGRIVWTRGYGYADVEKKTAVTPETLFQAASISKPVASLAALHMVEEGKLSLDEDVNAKLKSWKVPENEFTKEQKVTLRRLLTHSAGLTVHGFPGYASEEAVPTVVEVLDGQKPPANTAAVRVDTEPGKTWRYSGGGFTVMQQLLTDVSGKTFQELMSELVLKPAGMTHSTYQQPLPKEKVGQEATPYRASGEPVKGGPHTYPEMAAAGLWTTPSDLGRMAMEVEREYHGASQKILTQAMAKQYLTRQKDRWGLGVGLEGEGRTLQFSHGGANEGYRCDFVEFPELHQGAAIMTNSDAGGEVMAPLLRAIAKEYGWPGFQVTQKTLASVEPKVLAAYAGEYSEEHVGKLDVTLKDGKLYLKAEALGPEAQELLPESATEFFLLTETLKFRFTTKPGKPAESIAIDAGPQAFIAKRVN
jgi:CubicO group peptidase (beta-lactamase class C family)